MWVSFGFVYLGLYLLVKLGLGNGNAVEIFNFFGIILEVSELGWSSIVKELLDFLKCF